MGRGPVGEPAIIKYVNNSLASVDDVSGINGSMILIKTLTASSSDDLTFVNGSSDVVLDSTYPIYKFVCTNIHPSADGEEFTFNFRDGGSSYDATKTSSYFLSEKPEADSGGSLSYQDSRDLAQATGVQHFGVDTGNDNDQASSGELWLFNPSSTTYVKNFMGTLQQAHQNDLSLVGYVSGYCNVTAAIDGVQFKMSSGTIDAGTIKLYGIKDS